MEILHPLAFWLLPLAAIPFLLARRRPRRQRRFVSSLRFWKMAETPRPEHPAVRRPRPNWLVILQTVFVLAIVAALAHPEVSSPPSRVTFVFDLSASMGAINGAKTRLQLARVRAQEFLAGAGSGVRAHVIEAGSVAVDRGELTGLALQSELDNLRPQAGGARLKEALENTNQGSETWVFTDAAKPDSAASGRLHWIRVGQPAPNVAVTAFAARRLSSSADVVQAIVEVTNFSDAPSDATLTINTAGQTVAREAVYLNPHAARSFIRDITGIAGALSARVAAADDSLAIDNERFTVVPARRQIAVRIITSGNFFLERALASNADWKVETSAPATAAGATGYDVVVCDMCTTPPPGLAGVLMITPPGAALPPAPLIVSLAAHPLAQDLEGGLFVSVVPSSSENGDVVVRAGDIPLVSARNEMGRRIVTLNADLHSSAFPLSTAFPVLIANAVEWLAGVDLNPTHIVAGDPLQWTMRGDASRVPPTVVGPDGRALPYTLVNRRLTLTSTERPGIYTVRGDDVEQRVAINVATDTESDLSHATSAISLPSPRSSSPNPPFDLSLWLLCIATGAFAAEWWLSRRYRPGAIAWPAAIAIALVLAVAGVRLPLGPDRSTAVFVLDRSGSVSLLAQRAAIDRTNAMMTAMRDGDLAGIITFGSEAAVDRRPSSRRAVTETVAAVPEAGTNVEGALTLARMSLGAEGQRRVVLMSDGNETSGDAARESALAAAAGLKIDVVPVESGLSTLPPIVNAVRAPEQVRVGEPFRVTVEVSGRPGSRALIALTPEGRSRVTRDVAIGRNGIGTTDLADQRDAPGSYTFRAAVVTPDGEEPSAGTVVSVSGQPQMLFVSLDRAAPATPPVLPALLSAGFHLTRVTPQEIPVSEAALTRYDAVILDDVPAAAMTDSQAGALTSYVERTGGGLLLLGSARSLDSGGYAESAIGQALPIDLHPRNGRRAPPMAFVLAFDKSGSMGDRSGGVPKIELARESVMRVVKLIPSTDSLGIIAFDAQPRTIAPLGTDHRAEDVSARLRGIDAGGPTAIGPALELAGEWLRQSSAVRRHVLLISDGRTSPADADRMRAAARTRGYELSVIAIGSDADRAMLQAVAEQSGGHAYFPDDIRQLPQIVARDAAEAAGGTVVEERFRLHAPDEHPVLAGIDLHALPTLDGYVVGVVKTGADAILTSHLNDPVLAAWRFGLGRVVIFTGAVDASWSAAMRRWPGFGPLWMQTSRWMSRGTTTDLLHLHSVETDDGERLRVDAVRADGRAAALEGAQALLRSPSGTLQEALLHPIEPGHYEAEVTLSEIGGYQVAITARDGESILDEHLVRGFYWSGEKERSTRGVNRTRLAQIAEITGGRVLTGDDSPFADPRPLGYREVTTEWELLALLLFLLHLARRSGITPSIVREWWRRRHVDDLAAREAA